MGALKIKGETSGSTTITAPDSGGDETIELSTALASKLDLAGTKILQIVRATDSTNRSTTSSSFVDVTGMSVTITPQKEDSAILVIAFCTVFLESSTESRVRARFRITDTSNNPISGAEEVEFWGTQVSLAGIGAQLTSPLTIIGRVTPATTSPVEHKLQFLSETSAGTGAANVRNAINTGQMYAIEVSA